MKMEGPLATSMTVDDILNSCSFSWFTIKLIVVTSLFWFISVSEMAMTAVVAPYIAYEWNLSPLRLSGLSACMFLGNGIGASYFGRISDVYGRKLPMFAAGFCALYFNVLETASTSFLWYGVLRFFLGILTGGIMVSSATFLSEFIGSKHRGKAIAAMSTICTIANFYTGLMAYLTLNTQGWRVFLLLSSVPFILLLLSVNWFPESIRFLQVSGNRAGVLETLYKICKQSNKPLPPKITLYCKYMSQKGDFAVLTGKRFRKTLVLLMFLWVVTLMTYYGTTFLTVYTLQDIGDSNDGYIKFENTSTMGHYQRAFSLPRHPRTNLTNTLLLQNMFVVSSELPGAIIYIFLIDFVGRKPCLILGFLYLAIVFLLQNFRLPTTLSLFLLLSGRAVGYGSTAVLFIFTAEHFPTVIRTSGIGICSMVGRWSLVIVPYLFQYVIYRSLPAIMAIFVALNLIGCILCWKMKETFGKNLESE